MNRSSGVSTAQEQRFSEANAIQLCGDVETMEAQAVIDEAQLSKVLRDLAELLVYNDKHNEAVVDKVMMERDLMSTLERLVTNAMLSSAVKVSVLQCVMLLLQNLTRVSSVYFICSNNRINRMIAIPLDVDDDEELVSMYVSFLKSLALRLNKDMVQFFFEADSGAFPLFSKAVKLLSTATVDPMVRAAARQIVVCVALIDDAALQRFLVKALVEVYDGVLRSIAGQLAQTSQLLPRLKGVGGTKVEVPAYNVRAVVVLMEDIVDDMLYLNDLYRSAPSATDSVALHNAAEEVLLGPLRCLLTEELRSTDTNASLSSSALHLIPPSAALGFLTRWASVNEIGVLQDALVHMLLETEGAGSGPHSLCLVCRLLQHCPHLVPTLLLLREALLPPRSPPPSGSSGGTQTDDSPSRRAAALSSPAPSPLSAEHADDLWTSADALVARLTAPDMLHPEKRKPNDVDSVRCLLRILHCHLTRDVNANTLCGLVSLLRQLREALSLSGFHAFAAVTRELCRTNLRQKAADTSALMDSLFAGAVCAGEAASRPGSPPLEQTSRWLARHWYVERYGVRDAHLVVFLEVRAAWDRFTRSKARDAAFKAHGERDVASLWPLLPPMEDCAAAVSWDSRTRERYRLLQSQICESWPLWQRAALTEEEKEDAVLLLWFVLDRFCAETMTIGPVADTRGQRARTLEDVLEPLRVKHRPGSVFAFHVSTAPPPFMLRCEMVMMWYAAKAEEGLKNVESSVAPGTCMYLTLTPAEALFLAEPESSTSTLTEEALSGVCERVVLLSLDLAYVRAAVLPAPAAFRAVLQELCPGKEVEMHLVFKDEVAAALAVTQLHGRASRARKQAALLLRDLIGGPA